MCLLRVNGKDSFTNVKIKYLKSSCFSSAYFWSGFVDSFWTPLMIAGVTCCAVGPLSLTFDLAF